MKALKNNGLTIALLLLFLVSIVGQWLAGWQVANQDAAEHGRAAMGLSSYAASPEFLSTVFENWESEFLQMATYVLLTAVLIQRGSAESKDPEEPPRDADLAAESRRPDAPGALRMGRLARALYARSLGLVLAGLFVFAFVAHWTQSARAAAEEAARHGAPQTPVLAYLGDPQLWFESFQNWQSEFLSTAVLVVLSIVLRQKGSPESKPVAAPHGATGA